MQRIVMWLATTVTIVVLLFGYHTSTNSATPASVSSHASTRPDRSSTAVAAPPSNRSHPTSRSSASVKTYTGSTAQTRWGPVQVKITVASGKITAVDVLQSPNGNPRDQKINDHALPILVQDTLTAQSANIDMVSGATVTSDGYIGSLQSALDKAGL